MPFSKYLPKLLPPPLQGEVGLDLVEAIGKHFDGLVAQYKDAVNARFPAYCNQDDIDRLGHERGLARHISETPANHRLRVLAAWDEWQGTYDEGGGGGTHQGLLNALHTEAGINTTIVQHNGLYVTRNNDGSFTVGDLMACASRKDLDGVARGSPGWEFGQGDTFWSLFGILHYQPADPAVDRSLVNATVERWRPGNAIHMGTWVVTAGSHCYGWPTTQTWNQDAGALKWGGDTVTYYGPTGYNATTGQISADGNIMRSP
jgi:hypothetical protein